MKYLGFLVFIVLISCKEQEMTQVELVNLSDSLNNVENVFLDVSFNENSLVEVNEPAPNFTLNEGTDQEFKLSDLRNKVVMITFEAEWCSICKIANPILNEEYLKADKEKFELIKVYADYVEQSQFEDAINRDEGFIKVYDRPSNSNKLKNLFDVRSYPASFLIDRDGVVRRRFSPLSFDFLSEAYRLYDE